MASVAKLWITDNDYYVIRGYRFTGPDGDEDSFVRTYHVSPRGSSLIENLGWRDGKELPKSIFYALVIDGDLFYPDRARPSIRSVPAEILMSASHYSELCVPLRREFRIPESMLFVEMSRHLHAGFRGGDLPVLTSYLELFRYIWERAFRGGDLEMLAEIAGFWRLASANEAHRRDLVVKHLREKARMGQLGVLYPFDIEVLVKDIPPSFKQTHEVVDFLRAKYSFLPENCVQQLAAEYLARKRRSE